MPESVDVHARDPVRRRIARLQEATRELAAADPLSRERHVKAWLSLAPRLLGDEEGLEALYACSVGFDAAGGFSGTPWNDPLRLRPRLWAGSFDADEPYPSIETASTLRLLAVALGESVREEVQPEEARRILERILALNLDKILDTGSEASRAARVRHHDAARALLRFVLQRLPRAAFVADVAKEVDAVMAQRPVWTHDVRRTLRLVSTAPGADEAEDPLLSKYVEAILGPTAVSMRFRDPAAYRKALDDPDVDVDAECTEMAASLRDTGLACAQHAVLVRHVAHDPARLAAALGLDDIGRTSLEAHTDRVEDLVRRVIAPTTCQTLYGLARMLERGLLDRSEVIAGMDAMTGLEIPAELAETLLRSAEVADELTASDTLLGGVVRVLGLPLGIGQGNNPTCQAARGISLWASHRPAHLLDLIRQTVRNGAISLDFEGFLLRSDELGGGLAPTLHPDLDPVSLVLVPHLDRLYNAMMQRTLGRIEDGHKWVNPALYGQLVPPGYTSCFDPLLWTVRDHPGFVRRFYATFHPACNEGHPPVHATPVGITVTDDRARLLGLHAVSITRVDEDPDGEVRVYFYNPNNEGRQDWGEGVVPSVQGNGEHEGESSLPFVQFASRLYAFHHPVDLPGDPAAVDDATVEAVTTAARRSWGRSYSWT